MKKLKLKAALAILLFAALSLFSSASYALEIPNAPREGYVLDNAEILSPEEETNLSSQILQIKNSTTNEIGILTLKDGEGIEPVQLAVEVFKKWGIGSSENENGVLITVILQNPKSIRISPSRNLEGALTDAQSGQISRNEVAPQFREEKYYEGLARAVSAIDAATKGEYQSSGNSSSLGKTSDFAFEALFFGFILLQGLFSIVARTKSWWLGGVFGFAGSSIIGTVVHSFLLGLILSIIFVPLGLALDYFVSKNYKKHKDKKKTDGNHIFPWYFGGGSGGLGSGSSGGFGGFGGGGSFGGGGGGSSW